MHVQLALTIALLATATASAQIPLLHNFDGPKPGARLGTAVGGAGDVDADGYDDVIAGATDGNGTSNQVGHAFVFSGRDGRQLHEFRGNSSGGDAFGAAVAGAGDVDGDGHDDLVVGARYDRSRLAYAGSVHVFSGRDGKRLHEFHGEGSGDRLGVSVAGAGDANGDGFADVVAGAYFANANGFWSGSVYVWSGRNGRLLWKRHGDTEFHFLGVAVAGAGDVDADGFDDVIAGAYGDDTKASNGGLARVYSGRDGRVLHDFYGASPGARFGTAVGGAGDIDGDGHADLIVGSWSVTTSSGRIPGTARVFSGATGSVLWTFTGKTSRSDQFGSAVAGVGDVNGDGRPDVAVGAYTDDPNGASSGSVSVFSGADGTRLAIFAGAAAGDLFGVSVAGAGDTNGDGLADIVAGAPHASGNGDQSGNARVLAIGGAEAYGSPSGSRAAVLGWRPGAGAPAAGTLRIEGATPAASGILAVSAGEAHHRIGPLVVLVDITPGAWVPLPLVFDGAGRAMLGVDLRLPALAGTVVRAQALDATAPSLSNALRLLLAR